MIAEQLKKSILNAAIQGKLTKQFSEDGNAHDIVFAIQKEITQFVNSAKTKKERPLPVINEEDVPFDIPENWCWVKLGSISKITNGFTPLKSNARFWNSKDIPWFTISDIRNQGHIITSTKEFISKSAINGNDRVLPPETILLCCTASIGEFAYSKISLTTNQQFNGITVKDSLRNYINPKYIYYYIQTLSSQLLLEAGKTTFPFLSTKKLSEFLVPIAPYSEQERIIGKIESVLSEIEKLKNDETKLHQLQTRFPKMIKDSILQHAIQGKLTKQLPEDGDARDLLKEIQNNKAHLIKEGKIKKEKPLVEIFEDEIPFDIPENWCWVRLGEIITLKSGQDMTPDKYSSINSGIPYITGASNFSNGSIYINRWTELPQSVAYKGDLLITCKGTIGELAFLNEEKAHIARQVMAINGVGQMDNRYVLRFLMWYVSELKSMAKSMIPGISRDMVLNLLIPLPPIAEQNRIVNYLENLLPLCDALE